MFRSTWYVAVAARVQPAADRGRGGAQLEERRLLEEEERLGRARCARPRRRARGVADARSEPPRPGDGGVGSGRTGAAAGHQEKDLGTSGTPANGGRSGDGMRPCAAARR